MNKNNDDTPLFDKCQAVKNNDEPAPYVDYAEAISNPHGLADECEDDDDVTNATYEIGYQAGFEDGYQEGYDDGYSTGYWEG